MRRRSIVCKVLLLAAAFAVTAAAQIPTPVIGSLSPNSVPAGSSSFTLTVIGSGFIGSQPPSVGTFVRWRRGLEPELVLPTTWISDTEVRASVAADLVGSAGNITIRVENRFSATSSTFSNSVNFTVTDRPQITTPPDLPDGNIGVPYSVTLTATGGIPPYGWFRVEGALPPGLDLTQDGTILGTPVETGTYSVQITVYDAREQSDSEVFRIRIVQAPLSILTGSELPRARLNEFYTTTLNASGGRPPYSWTRTSGSLPPGLTLFGDGIINGQPSQAGLFQFSMTVRDQAEDTVTQEFTLLVVGPLSITTASPLPGGVQGTRYSRRLQATGGVPPYMWSLASGLLPGGLTLDSRGTISGTPVETGTFDFRVAVMDQEQVTARKNFLLTITSAIPPLTITTPVQLPDATERAAYTATLAAEGGEPPYRWSVVEGELPGGLSLDAASGVISGSAEEAGEYSFTILVGDTGDRTAEREFRLRVLQAPLAVVTEPILPQGAVGSSYSLSFEATGGVPPYSWERVLGDLPSGLSLDSGGQMSGIPSAGGDFGFRLRVTDAAGESVQQDFAVRITAPDLPGISVEGLPPQTQPADPQDLQIMLAAPYPADLTGVATLEFTPDATAPADDPAVQFASGGRTVQFSIPSGSTAGRFGDADSLGVQTGSVAGLIRVTVTIEPGGGQSGVTDVHEMTVLRTAPSINSVTLSRTSNGFEVAVVGMSSPRDMTRARFRFTQRTGTNLQTTEVTVQLGEVFSSWYTGAESAQYGSTFRYVQPFTIQGDSTAVASVSVLLVNSSGDSQEMTQSF